MKRISLAAGLLALASVRPVGAAGTVPVRTPAPFDRWCLAPICTEPFASPAAIAVPKIAADDSNAGYAENQLRAAVAKRIETWLDENAAGWNSKPIRDLARASISAVLHEDDRFAAAQGLGAAVLRAGLTLRLDPALPRDPGCEGAARLDAIYEGLGVSRSLAALAFPEATRTVASACATTTERTVEAVDGTMLRALDRTGDLPKVLVAAKKLRTAVRAAIDACATVKPGDPAHGSKTVAAIERARSAATIGAYVEVVDAATAESSLHSTWVEGPSAACGAAAKDLVGIELQPFGSGLARTLRGADLQAFVDRASSEPLSCAEETCAAAKHALLAAQKGVDKELLRALIADVRTRLRSAVTGSSVLDFVLEALDAAVIGDSAAATVDGRGFVRAVLAKYCVDEDGGLSMSCAAFAKPEPLVLEANGGVPRLGNDDLRLVGDLTLGWKTRAFGIVGRGSVAYYDYTNATGDTDNLHAKGALEAWYRTGDDGSAVRLEIRASGGLDYYDATYAPSGPAATSGYFHDEDSTLGRGTLLIGALVRPSERFLLDVLVGGGAQYESYGYLATDPADRNVLSDSTAISGRAHGRLLLRWTFWPSILALRANAEGSLFRLTRDVLTVSQIGRPAAAGVTSTEITQLETSARVFLDFDVAKLLGFVPAAWGGVDHVRISSDVGDATVVVPVVGIGIVRPTF